MRIVTGVTLFFLLGVWLNIRVRITSKTILELNLGLTLSKKLAYVLWIAQAFKISTLVVSLVDVRSKF